MEATVFRQYGWLDNEGLYIYKGTSDSGSYIFSMGGNYKNMNKQYTSSVCIQPNYPYYIKLFGKYGWSDGSFVELSYNNTVFLGVLLIKEIGLLYIAHIIFFSIILSAIHMKEKQLW